MVIRRKILGWYCGIPILVAWPGAENMGDRMASQVFTCGDVEEERSAGLPASKVKALWFL
jgi:hypothetical protein